MIERITVVGGGNGAHAMAADLSALGHPVTLFEFPEFAAGIQQVLHTRQIELRSGRKSSISQLENVTTDPEEAVSQANWLMVAVPSFGHEHVACTFAPFLRDGQKIVIYAGTFGSIVFRKTLDRLGCKAKVDIIETSTLPYGARVTAPGIVECPLRAERVLAACFPSNGQESAIGSLRRIYPTIECAENVAGVALSNVNPIVHPIGALLNTGRIEHAEGDFYLYKEGITASVARAIREIHREFTAVGSALGVCPTQFNDRDFEARTSITSVEFRAEFDTTRIISTFKGPFDIKDDRYVSEDVPYGLVPVASLAGMLKVEVPTITSTIHLFSIMNEKDYWKEGWTVEKLGISGQSRSELKAFLERGASLKSSEVA